MDKEAKKQVNRRYLPIQCHNAIEKVKRLLEEKELPPDLKRYLISSLEEIITRHKGTQDKKE